MNKNLLFNQRHWWVLWLVPRRWHADVRNVNRVENSWAMPMDENAELPVPLAFYDFQSETAEGYELKSFGNGTKPEFSMVSETEQCLDLWLQIIEIWGMCKSQILLKTRHLTTAHNLFVGVSYRNCRQFRLGIWIGNRRLWGSKYEWNVRLPGQYLYGVQHG